MQLLSALAAAYMLDRRLDESIEHGERSRALAGPGTDETTDLNTSATLGSVLLFAGRTDAGWDMLEDAVSRSVRLLHEGEAARAYRMAGTSASVIVEYDRGATLAARGHRLRRAGRAVEPPLATWLPTWRTCSGRSDDWDEARQTAQRALADGRGGITTRITAEYVLGYIAMGRAEWDSATELFEQALAEAAGMAELQRVSPPLWGLAETAQLRGGHDRAVELCERGYAESGRVQDAAYLFPFLVTGTRARLALRDEVGAADWVERVATALELRSIPGTLPAIDHARGLVELATNDLDAAQQSLAAAAAGWQGRGRFWEGTWAQLDLARSANRSKRHTEAAALAAGVRAAAEPAGAAVLVAAADELLEREARSRANQPWHPLTAREYAVATLVADGLTNREIAARLVLSPKTVSAHVEHILTKLGASRRAEIAAWAARVEAR